jgi:hypothetical protein
MLGLKLDGIQIQPRVVKMVSNKLVVPGDNLIKDL